MGVTQPGNNACSDGNHGLIVRIRIPIPERLRARRTITYGKADSGSQRLLQWKVHADEPEVHKILRRAVLAMRIAVVGSGYVGLVTGACFADLGHEVVLVDNDEKKLAALRDGRGADPREVPARAADAASGKAHSRFPATCRRPRGRAQRCSSRSGRRRLKVATPISPMSSPWRGKSPAALKGYKVVVEKSTVPVYTSQWVRTIITEQWGGIRRSLTWLRIRNFCGKERRLRILSIPTALWWGWRSERAAEVMRQIYGPLTSGWYYGRTEMRFRGRRRAGRRAAAAARSPARRARSSSSTHPTRFWR
jgi:hypothetical protein